jgi:hypothetical protein
LLLHTILRTALGELRSAGKNRAPPQKQQTKNKANEFQKPVRRDRLKYTTVQKTITTIAGKIPAGPKAPNETPTSAVR